MRESDEEKEGIGDKLEKGGSILESPPEGMQNAETRKVSEGWAVTGLKGHASRRAWALSSRLRASAWGPRKKRAILKRRILAVGSEVEKTKETLMILPMRYIQYVEAELTAVSGQQGRSYVASHPESVLRMQRHFCPVRGTGRQPSQAHDSCKASRLKSLILGYRNIEAT